MLLKEKMFNLENKLEHILLCAAADAQRNTMTKMYVVKKGLEILLGCNGPPSEAQINMSFSKMPKNWNQMLVCGWYMNATDTLYNKRLSMENFKKSLIAGIMMEKSSIY
tara:strand:- start:2151 stop:2477 length:327 start_codon:yes stop_codon:yes gene_type:complete